MLIFDHISSVKAWKCTQHLPIMAADWAQTQIHTQNLRGELPGAQKEDVVSTTWHECSETECWVVGGFNLPLWKIWVRQLGSWHPNIWKNNIHVPNHQPVIINHDYITIINHHYPILNQSSSHHQAVNQMICKTQHPKPLKDHAGSCRSYKNRVADTLSMARSKQILLQKKNANRPNLDTHPVFHVLNSMFLMFLIFPLSKCPSQLQENNGNTTCLKLET